jgi:hypothetical protein
MEAVVWCPVMMMMMMVMMDSIVWGRLASCTGTDLL